MREILFRGKTTLDNEWAIGAGVYKSEGNTWIITDDVTKTENRGTGSDAINPETVGQYTGLTDKNGKKIFEGDIVRYGDTVHEVVFEQRNGTAYFGLVYNSLETLPFGHYQDLKQIVVIGNIHDNPELLKGE